MNIRFINPDKITDFGKPNVFYDSLCVHSCEVFSQYSKKKILKWFEFKDEIRKKACDVLPEGVLVSLHVRRGDYLNLQLSDTHKNQSQKYYQDAMLKFEGYRPVVFSDDIEWCKEEMAWLKNNHPDPVFMSYDHFTDLCLMSLCNGHIIANSSFSWWGAWLGGGKTVAPKEWFGPSGPKNWKDVYCEDWITL